MLWSSAHAELRNSNTSVGLFWHAERKRKKCPSLSLPLSIPTDRQLGMREKEGPTTWINPFSDQEQRLCGMMLPEISAPSRGAPRRPIRTGGQNEWNCNKPTPWGGVPAQDSERIEVGGGGVSAMRRRGGVLWWRCMGGGGGGGMAGGLKALCQ